MGDYGGRGLVTENGMLGKSSEKAPPFAKKSQRVGHPALRAKSNFKGGA
jgi:hypothetical protein